MARIYADLIRKKLKKLEDVPACIRPAVAALLKEAADEQIP